MVFPSQKMIQCIVGAIYIYTYIYWLVVYLPLWKTWVSWDDDYSQYDGKKCSKPPTSIYIYVCESILHMIYWYLLYIQINGCKYIGDILRIQIDGCMYIHIYNDILHLQINVSVYIYCIICICVWYITSTI